MIAIIDYGMGNIHSVNKALQLFGAKTIITNNPKDIASCEKAVLPGVGAFDDAMQELKKQNLIPALEKLLSRQSLGALKDCLVLPIINIEEAGFQS